MARLQSQGFSPEQSAAITGNIQQESSFDPTSLNAPEGALGLMQWRGDRRAGLENYAREQGLSPTDLEAQIGYIGQERQGSEAGNYDRALGGGGTPGEMATRFAKYVERPGDTASYGQRAQYANAAYGGQPTGGNAAFPSPAIPPNEQLDGTPTGFHPKFTPPAGFYSGTTAEDMGGTRGAGGAGGSLLPYGAGGGTDAPSSPSGFKPAGLLRYLNPLNILTAPIDIGYGIADEVRHATGMRSSYDKLAEMNQYADVLEHAAGIRTQRQQADALTAQQQIEEQSRDPRGGGVVLPKLGTTTIADRNKDPRIQSTPIPPGMGTSPYPKAQGRDGTPWTGSNFLSVVTGSIDDDMQKARARIKNAQTLMGVNLMGAKLEHEYAGTESSRSTTRLNDWTLGHKQRFEGPELERLQSQTGQANDAAARSRGQEARDVELQAGKVVRQGQDVVRYEPDANGLIPEEQRRAYEFDQQQAIRDAAEARARTIGPSLQSSAEWKATSDRLNAIAQGLRMPDPVTGLTPPEKSGVLSGADTAHGKVKDPGFWQFGAAPADRTEETNRYLRADPGGFGKTWGFKSANPQGWSMDEADRKNGVYQILPGTSVPRGTYTPTPLPTPTPGRDLMTPRPDPTATMTNAQNEEYRKGLARDVLKSQHPDWSSNDIEAHIPELLKSATPQ
jgi:hypothetical protein